MDKLKSTKKYDKIGAVGYLKSRMFQFSILTDFSLGSGTALVEALPLGLVPLGCSIPLLSAIPPNLVWMS